MLQRIALLGLAALAAGWLFLAYREAHTIEVNHQEIGLARLPAEFDGFRVLLMSDLHLSANRAFTAQVGDRLGSIQADLLLIAGDFKDLFADEKTAAAQMQRLLPSFQRIPRVYAVNGNLDSARMMLEIESLGIRVLRNEREILTRGGATLGIAGVSYPYAKAGLERSLNRFRNDQGRLLPDCEILLGHSPDVILWGQSREADLVLAGHTHGGQVRLPLLGAVITRTELGRRYASGLFTFGTTQLFVTRGVGTTYLPLRFLAPPEIVLITLRARPR
ncbi:MAG: metallophosphoesterase [Acidobacteria bacterium]|nr:metallophosphoesterase [Acidobacteriota bacterium]